jgi:hypothetical protein
MRQLFLPLAISLTVLAHSSTHDARVYIFDSEPLSPALHDREVPPDAAKLILSRRLRLSQGSALGQADGEVVKFLNEFGGRQCAVLGNPEMFDDISRLLVVWEGVAPYSGKSQ